MNKIYNTRTSFVIDVMNKCNFPSKKILDVGFIGGYEEAVHYNIVESLKESDSLVGIDIDESKMNQFLSNPKTIVECTLVVGQIRLGHSDKV